MRAAKNRETVDSTMPEAARPGSKLSPLATLALGAGAYLALAAVVDLVVIRVPEGNRVLQTALIAMLGLAFVLAAEGFLATIRATPRDEIQGWPLCAAAAGSVAYSVVYGHRVFVNYWYYDDWGYLVRVPLGQWITAPLNDHFVPLLKLVLWGMRRVFGFDYIGAACLQQAAFLLIVVVLAHLLWRATRQAWALVLLVGLFAMWPSYGAARTWFGGGFWLTASTALLAVYVLHARRIVFAETMRAADITVSFALAAATVFISSQTPAPGIYLAAFWGPALLWAQRRNVAARRLGLLCAVSVAPTALSLWGRAVYVGRAPLNFSGLFDGSLFANLAIFILQKALFVNAYDSLTSLPVRIGLYSVCLAALVAAFLRLAVSQSIDSRRRAELAGLILGGCALFVVPLVQIGLARRWSYHAVLNSYYVTLPFLGLWLAGAGVVLTLTARPERVSKRTSMPSPAATDVAVSGAKSASVLRHRDPRRAPRRPAQQTPQAKASVPRGTPGGRGATWRALGAAAAFAMVMTLAGLAVARQPVKPTPARRVQLVGVERQFIASLGAAECDLAELHRKGPPVRWVPRQDLLNCRVCREIIGPPEFMRDLGFGQLVRIAADRSCPADDLRMVLPTAWQAPSAAVTDGSESAAARAFVRQYLTPPDNSMGQR